VKTSRPRTSDNGPYRKREDGARPQPRRDFDERPPRRFEESGEGARKPFRPRAEQADRPARAAPKRQAPESAGGPVRIAKAMARAGLCSRRDAEEWIAEGRVSVNGTVIDSPALNVTEADRILVDGERLPEKERTRLWLYHKPAGLVTTASDPEGRPTVFDNLPEDLPRVMSIGRLDINTEGLLLLTNDGGLARVLELPETGWLRRYRVRAHGETDQAQLDRLKQGVTIDGVDYDPIHATLDRVQGRNVWLTLDLREGKNREVKVVLEHVGLMVNRLIRVSFGPFQLGDIREGDVEEIRTRMLKDQLGERLAAEAEADFDGPRRDAPKPRGEDVARDRDERKPQRRPERRGDDPDRAPRRFVGERSERPARFERRPRFEQEDPRGRVLIDETDPYAPPPGERSRKPAERNVYREDEAALKPRYKRLDREEFASRRRAAATGDDPTLKIERGETSDRAGRRVRVERIRGPQEEERPARPARSFRDRDDRRPGRDVGPPRHPERDGEDRPRRFSRSEGPPRGDDSGKPYRRPRSDDGERRPRSFGADERPRRFERSDERGGSERPPRKPYAGSSSSRFDGKSGEGPPRRPRERSESGYGYKPRGGPGKSGGGFRGKPSGPGGRPGGARPGGGRPGGGRGRKD
jgi:23S rRNA pseudouridine2605 synthase